MKRIIKIASTVSLAVLISSGFAFGQEKKEEQRIKIIVDDKSGTKVIIDTLITGTAHADSIKLKNGEVIYLTSHGNATTISHGTGDNKTVFVTVSDQKEGKNVTKEITVISGDSTQVIHATQPGKVVILREGKPLPEGAGGKTVTWSSVDGTSSGSNYFYVNEDHASSKNGEKTFIMKLDNDENSSTEKMKYVIAKDGMVISIEGNDAEKVKEMVKEVETKLGISKTDKEMKQTTKEETKKPAKK